MLSFLQAGECHAPTILHHHFALGREAGPQDERAGPHAGGLHTGGFCRGGHTEEFQVAVIQSLDYAFDAVAIRFGFDNGHLFVAGQYTANHGQVMTHGIGIDFGPGTEE